MGAVLLTLGIYAVTLDEMNEVFDEELKQVALTAVAYLQDKHIPTRADSASSNADLEDFKFVTQVWSLRGEMLYSQIPGAGIPFFDHEGLRTFEAKGVAWRIYTDQSGNYFTQAAQPMDVRHDLAAEIALKILVPCLLAIPLLGMLILYAMRRGLLPLFDTAQEVHRRAADSLEPIPADKLPVEFQPLVVSINGLMKRLSQALEQQRCFIADAAHELRTPITALDLQTQLLLSASTEMRRREAAREIRRGLDRASHLVSQLLQLSRLEPEAPRVAHELVQLDELARSVVADFSASAEARQIDLGAGIADVDPTRYRVEGSADELRVLLNNLVDNAIRYTPSNGRIDVRVIALATSGEVVLEVADTGPGVPMPQRQRVFDRFYRVPSASTDDGLPPGTGLGLSIVRAIALRHGGTVELADKNPSELLPGLVVRCVFGAWRSRSY